MAVVEDVAPQLLEQLKVEFQDRLQKNQELQNLLAMIDEGEGTYIHAGNVANEIGTALSQTFGNCISSESLPDGRMYYNIAERTVAPMLEEEHKLIAEASEKVQTSLNKKAKIGLKAQTVPVDEDRVEGIVNKISAADHFDDVAWVLGEPVVNYAMSVVDYFIKANVDFQGKAGLQPKIIRKAERRCCKWCNALAGEYDYPDVPDDVYRRHENCRCQTDYDPGTGRRQNVHTKLFTEPEETARIETRKVIGRKVNGTTIREVGKHVYDQMAARNVTMESILDAITNPLEIKPVKYDEYGRPSFIVVGRKATVTINPETGKISTTYPTHTKTANRLLRKKGMK